MERFSYRDKDKDHKRDFKNVKVQACFCFHFMEVKTTRHLRFLIFGDINFRWVGKESSCVGTEAVRDGK